YFHVTGVKTVALPTGGPPRGGPPARVGRSGQCRSPQRLRGRRGEVEDRRHQDGKEGGQRRPNVARQQQQPDGPPVGRRVVPEQPEEPPNVARARHARLGFGSGSASGRRSVRSFSCGIPSRMSSARYGSGRSSVATMTPSTCSSGRRLTACTRRPRKTPPASRAKTPRGSSPSSFSVTYASSAASPTP